MLSLPKAAEVKSYADKSRGSYAAALSGRTDYPEILYFPDHHPRSVREAGRYVNFDDFRDVSRDTGMDDVPLATLYHSLVLHFARRQDEAFYDFAWRELRYNPNNHSSWNRSATTYRYWLLGNALLPYAAEKVTPEFKIEGVANKGRMVLRAVLFEEFEESAREN